MNEWSRRRLLKQFAAVSVTLVLPSSWLVGESPETPLSRDCEIQIATVSPHTVRLTVLQRRTVCTLVSVRSLLHPVSFSRPCMEAAPSLGLEYRRSGPTEAGRYDGWAIPDASQLRNEQVEPICRKYLELRYRMLPYLYSAVRECTVTGLPVMRALWLHHPDDLKAIECSDEYLWGRDLLVAPVVEKGANSRKVYLPRGAWYDFWSGERLEGGREFTRPVDLETVPLYVRAGTILPLGPVKQYTGQEVDQPLSLTLYPGADTSFLLYQDDGRSFNYRKGEWMGILLGWSDSRRELTLSLAPGSRLLPSWRKDVEVQLLQEKRQLVFDGTPLKVKL